jgi:phytoene dehydrogenase-like protein
MVNGEENIMAKKIVILGGGISGLTAGIYAQMKGFESEIYEKNLIPGGECTGWDRKGFHIDGCIHWMTGTKKGTEMGDIWREIGALSDDVPIYYPESFCTAEVNGVIVNLYSDVKKLREHLTSVSPEDKKEIDELVRLARIALDKTYADVKAEVA